MPNPEAGNSSRRPFLVALAGLFVAPLVGRADAIAGPLADSAKPEPDPSARDSFVGQITLITTDWIPRGYLECDGSEHSIADHQVLFSIVGTKFGGDGRRTFGVPQIRAPRGLRYVISTSGVFPSRS